MYKVFEYMYKNKYSFNDIVKLLSYEEDWLYISADCNI